MEEGYNRNGHGGEAFFYPDCTDFSANINFLGRPRRVLEKSYEAIARLCQYPDPECQSVKQALVRREWESFGVFLKLEQLVLGNGAVELLYALASALKPQRGLVIAPCFSEYEQALRVHGCMVQRFYTEETKNFAVDAAFLEAVSAFADELNGESGIVALANPNNPTGQLLERTLLFSLVGLCKKRKLFLLLDESFWDFLTEEDKKTTVSGIELLKEYSGLFVLRSFTKLYAMPGARFGYGFGADTDLVSRIREQIQPWNVNIVAQKMAEAAAGELAYARETAQAVQENRQWLFENLQGAGYRVLPSAANYLLFAGPIGLKEACLLKGVLIRDCANFPGLNAPGGGLGWYRICVRSMEENQKLFGVLREASEGVGSSIRV